MLTYTENEICFHPAISRGLRGAKSQRATANGGRDLGATGGGGFPRSPNSKRGGEARAWTPTSTLHVRDETKLRR